MTTYYATLGVAENASDEEINQAHHRLSRRSNQAERKIINTAFNTLKNPEKRRAYDEQLARTQRTTSNTHSSTESNDSTRNTRSHSTTQSSQSRQSSAPTPTPPRRNLSNEQILLRQKNKPVVLCFLSVFISSFYSAFYYLGKDAFYLFEIAWIPLKFIFNKIVFLIGVIIKNPKIILHPFFILISLGLLIIIKFKIKYRYSVLLYLFITLHLFTNKEIEYFIENLIK